MATLKANSTVGGNVVSSPPIGSVIGVHPDCTVAPDSNSWLYCDGATGTLGANFGARSAEAPPNLTDSRFLMGDTAYGTGGSNDTMAHTHSFTEPSAHGITQPTFTYPSHTHDQGTLYALVGTGTGSNVLYYAESGETFTATKQHGNMATITNSTQGARLASDILGSTGGDGGGSCTRTTSVALSNNHSGAAVTAVVESRTGQNIPLYLAVIYYMRIK